MTLKKIGKDPESALSVRAQVVVDSTPCPKCNAKIGQLCKSLAGVKLKRNVHIGRLEKRAAKLRSTKVAK